MDSRQLEILIQIVIAVGVFLIGLIIIKITLIVMKKALKKTKLDPVLHRFMLNAFKALSMIVLLLIVLDRFNIKTTSLVTVLGVGVAGIALALKDSLGNIAGGVMILATKPFSKDDFIDINGTQGIVQHIDLLLTTLKTYDNKVITIPNGIVTTTVLTNYSREDRRRVDTVFAIGYGDDFNKAKGLMLAVAESNPIILADPEPFIGVAGNKESVVELDFRVWTKTENYWEVKYFLEENVKIAFDEAGIIIPFKQLDIHIKK